MSRGKKTSGTALVPLELAKIISANANREWEEGKFLQKVTPITAELLKYWFGDGFCDVREINFHEGQKQAILNTIYMHEIKKTETVFDLYNAMNPELLVEMGMPHFKEDKYNHPKYAIKMATGTGKTWVMHALLIWQYLNEKHTQNSQLSFSKNFLLVAPGLIVYERLLDAYFGKEDSDGIRDFGKSDFKKYESLFIPNSYRDEVFAFIQSNTIKKENLTKQPTGDGLIAITNWHTLVGEEDNSYNYDDPLESPEKVIKQILPLTPGKSQGNELNALDRKYLRGLELEYLAKKDDMVVFNDEAHHIHEIKKGDDQYEVKWQEALSTISKSKQKKFIQIDFSATPYSIKGSGQKRTRHYFPHLIIDFDLKTAIRKGLVKTIVIDKRKELGAKELNFLAEKDDADNIIGLSEGQRVMLRAGLQKLKILEDDFVNFTKDDEGVSNKHPKMLVVCQDTKVAPFVTEFLNEEGLGSEKVTEIHSNRKGEIPDKEWKEVKQRLFNIDSHENPKVIVSVLMLREGFDVNNICVIVPLRSSQSLILLEQIIGRGLRLMWREANYIDIKEENRTLLLDKKESPTNYLDILSIVEHPAFIEFYEDLDDIEIANDTVGPKEGKSLGDLLKVELKENYEQYDLFFPIIIQDQEEFLVSKALSIDDLEPCPYSLETLKSMIADSKGDIFYSEELTVKTRFGEYNVVPELFTAKSYNEFLSKIVHHVTTSLQKTSKRKKGKTFPLMQVNQVELAELIDKYIRTRLFEQEFDPINDEWRVLFISEKGMLEHVIKQISTKIYEMQTNIKIEHATIEKRWFSEVDDIKIRENYSIAVSKTIYERLGYPSNKGGFEKRFIEFTDSDTKVKSFIKINEYQHDFARIDYIRDDGILANYYPDFVVHIDGEIYIVETKAQKDINDYNVQKKRIAAVQLIDKINQIDEKDRMNCVWNYALIGEKTFESLINKGADLVDVLHYAKMTQQKLEGKLDGWI